MKIDAELVLELRAGKSWSQEELSIASGLNIRTIQRIEREATISLQSKKALASAFNIDIHDLDYEETPKMKNHEYRSVTINFDSGIFTKKGTSLLDNVLNTECTMGWRLKQIIMPTDSNGMTSYMVAVLEREKTE